MPPRDHALLSASSAQRWLHCPPSARLTEGMEDTPSPYAAEGTRAHALCEMLLRRNLAMWPHSECSKLAGGNDDCGEIPDEMVRAANAYVGFLHELWVGFAHEPTVCVEQRVDLSAWVPEGFGTCDCLLIGDGVLHIVDFKYGQGVPVSPVENPQLLYYALGGYDLFRLTDEIETVRLSIVQPRIQAEPETWECSLAWLLDWGAHVLYPAARDAWNGEGLRHPGGWCRWCKLYPACTAWRDKYQLDGFEAEPRPADEAGEAEKGPRSDFCKPATTGAGKISKRNPEFEAVQDPAALTDEELGGWLKKLEGVAQYAKDLEAYAQQRLLEGHAIPGYKLVEGRSARTWTDQAAAFEALRADGYDDAVLYTRQPITLTSVEKLLGKKRFAAVMAPFVKRDPGPPKIADAADRRPEYHNLDGFTEV